MLNKTLIIGTMISIIALTGCSTGQSTNVKTESESTKQVSVSTSSQTESTEAYNTATTSKIDFDTLFPSKEIRDYAKGVIGLKAPDFKLTNLEGKEVQLSDFKGKDLIIEVVQTTCSACIQAQPEMDKFKQEHPDIPLVQVFPMENIVTIRDFLKNLNSPEHSNVLTGESGNTFVRDYKTKWTPTLYFVNKEGVISFLHVGNTDSNSIADMTKLAFK
ncbi:TlpA family protein disulfide reductase (plasmid) [Brevibacillus halotolerans]|nr:TlpA family protein disulfide reductase [Brevibacillus halotolerans]